MNRIIRAEHKRPDLVAAFKQLDAAPASHDMELVYRKHKRNRSHEQNSRYWAFMQMAAVSLGISAEDLHVEAKCHHLGYKEIALPDGRIAIVANSTAKLSVQEFTDYVDQVEAWLVCEKGATLDRWEAA